MTERYSDCCGSEAADGYEDSGICTRCNCHCTYETIEAYEARMAIK